MGAHRLAVSPLRRHRRDPAAIPPPRHTMQRMPAPALRHRRHRVRVRQAPPADPAARVPQRPRVDVLPRSRGVVRHRPLHRLARPAARDARARPGLRRPHARRPAVATAGRGAPGHRDPAPRPPRRRLVPAVPTGTGAVAGGGRRARRGPRPTSRRPRSTAASGPRPPHRRERRARARPAALRHGRDGSARTEPAVGSPVDRGSGGDPRGPVRLGDVRGLDGARAVDGPRPAPPDGAVDGAAPPWRPTASGPVA